MINTAWKLIKRTVSEFSEDDCMSGGAAIAYYTIFSLPPLLVIVLMTATTIGIPAERIDEIVKEAKADDDRFVKTLRQTIDRHQKKISSLKGEDPAKPENGEAGGMSFKDDVRPILAKYCGGCHIDNARGGLRLGSAAAAVQGGQKGPAVVPGNPNGSLMLRRIAAGQMPPGNRPKPNPQEIAVLAKWIADGAKEGGPSKKLPKVDVPKPTGNETVSFKEDIAPFMVNLCVGCHSGNNPRGGLNLTTVRNMMLGGDTGMVVLPGDLENSRMYRLVAGKEAPRMPQGQARITRKNLDDFTKWFEEGNKSFQPLRRRPQVIH